MKVILKSGILSKRIWQPLSKFLKYGAGGLSTTAITLATQYGLMAWAALYSSIRDRVRCVCGKFFFWNGQFVLRTTELRATGRFLRMLAARLYLAAEWALWRFW
jgi:hypothetical protein